MGIVNLGVRREMSRTAPLFYVVAVVQEINKDFSSLYLACNNKKGRTV